MNQKNLFLTMCLLFSSLTTFAQDKIDPVVSEPIIGGDTSTPIMAIIGWIMVGVIVGVILGFIAGRASANKKM